jgi:hypothetical protein
MLHFNFPEDKSAYDEILKYAESECVKIAVEHKFFVARDEIYLITESGMQYAKPGDYVIIGKDHAWCVDPGYFFENYVEVADD